MLYRTLIIVSFLSFIACSSDSYFQEDESTRVSLDFSNPKKISEYHERGRYIVSTIGACGHCHGSNLGGKPNITSNLESGIGSWKVDEIVTVLKGGPKKNGKYLASNVHKGLPWISDYDARSIAIYLLTSKPVDSEIDTTKAGMFEFIKSRPNVRGYVLNQKENANASYGRYLTFNIASCQSCHGTGLEGDDKGPKLSKKIAKWSKEQIVTYLESGFTAKGKRVSPKDCPWPYYRLSNKSDKQAIAFFLKTLL